MTIGSPGPHKVERVLLEFLLVAATGRGAWIPMSTAVHMWKEQVKGAHLYPDGIAPARSALAEEEPEEEREEATALVRRESMVDGILQAATKGRTTRSKSPPLSGAGAPSIVHAASEGSVKGRDGGKSSHTTGSLYMDKSKTEMTPPDSLPLESGDIQRSDTPDSANAPDSPPIRAHAHLLLPGEPMSVSTPGITHKVSQRTKRDPACFSCSVYDTAFSCGSDRGCQFGGSDPYGDGPEHLGGGQGGQSGSSGLPRHHIVHSPLQSPGAPAAAREGTDVRCAVQ